MKRSTLFYLKSLGLALLLVAIFWVSESLIHAYYFKLGSFMSQLMPHDSHEMWMRSLVVFLFVMIVLLAAYFVKQEMVASRKVQLAYKALEVMREGCVITDHRNCILYVNRRYEEISGYTLNEVIGKNPNVLSSGKQNKEFYETMWSQLLADGYWEGEIWNRKKSGELYPEWINLSTVKGKKGKIRYHVGVFGDITSQKAAEEKIKNYAYYDPLTKLANRRFFMERLVQHIKLAKRAEKKLAVLFLDLDRFKPINDTHGHAVGDEFLCQFAELLKGSLREVDTLSRFGGDEFVILLPDIQSKENATKVAEKLLAKCREATITVDAHDFGLHLSMGGAVYPDDGGDSETLIEKADEAMYQVKKGGRNGIRFYRVD